LVDDCPFAIVHNAPNYTFYLIEVNQCHGPHVFVIVDPAMICGWLRNFDLLDCCIHEGISLNPMFRRVGDIDNEEAEDLPKEILQLKLWCLVSLVSKFVNSKMVLEYE
jgi:hypothetical protein